MKSLDNLTSMQSLSDPDPFFVDCVLEAVETMVAAPKQPKVILFDIGGVCVSRSSFGSSLSFYT